MTAAYFPDHSESWVRFRLSNHLPKIYWIFTHLLTAVLLPFDKIFGGTTVTWHLRSSSIWPITAQRVEYSRFKSKARYAIFKAHWHLEPNDNGTPAYAQICFYAPEMATNTRLARSNQQRSPIDGRTFRFLTMLTEMLHDCKLQPLDRLYRTAREQLGKVDSR